ncbi:hypothetical protein GCM10023231_42250 [Olivibacter ginsenosidimutans]|uniref:PNPLA domain-containing protein n=1 Tax=Olivibacter ginsenosidimutans TaxID=1176537 RepID=A0ABP9CFW6_9SPHI
MAFHWKKPWEKKPPKIGLVLSGGGLRGIGHLGAIRALEEYGIKPSIISGCSAGAIIGACYAAGLSVEEMLQIVQNNDLFPTRSLRFRKTGFLDTGYLSSLIQKYIPENTFESLKIPLHVSTTDIWLAKTVYIHSGPLDQALLASSSIPFIFPAVTQNGSTYYDGGLLDNLPVTPLLGQCHYLIGIHVNALDHPASEQLSSLKMLDRVIHLAIGQAVVRNAQKCDLFIEPPNMLQFGLFDKKQLMPMVEYVYNHTLEQLATNPIFVRRQ